ncbi:MAG: helix-turn-helix domain-containing protein [Syntrophobacteraceae bacterium]
MNAVLNNLCKLLRELQALPTEIEWVEFKRDWTKPEDIGEYISALSNAAALHRKEKG